jgi:hypothetical protein
VLQSGHILAQAPPRQRLQEWPAAFNMEMPKREDVATVQVVLPPLLATAGDTGRVGVAGEGENRQSGVGGGKWRLRRERKAAAGPAPELDSPDPCRSRPALLGMLPWQEGGGHQVGREWPLALADPRGRHQQQQAP